MDWEQERKQEKEAKNRRKQMLKKLAIRIIMPVFILIVILAFSPLLIGVNDAGYRTVIQYPSGTLKVKFSAGIYMQWFGKIKEYNDFITFDHDVKTSNSEATIDQKGIPVRYQDGGMGSVYGISRFALPNDEDTMIELHKAFRSNEGVAYKLIRPVVEETMNLTAGLMNSEEAYATKRAIFTELAKAQISKGKFETVLKPIITTDATTGKSVRKEIPIIKEDAKTQQRIHIYSDLATYGISLAGFQLNNPGFEKRTLDQIAEKRAAGMAIITAKANAERAKQEAITAEEKGKADVVTAEYKKLVLKAQAVVDAERKARVAVIAAQQQVSVAEQERLEAVERAKKLVDVAEQNKLEAEQLKLAAVEYKQEQISRGEGDGGYKRLVMEADGALEQRLSAWTIAMKYFAIEFGKQKWVPEIQFGGNSNGNQAGASRVSDFMDLLMTKAAKDIHLDMTMKPQAKPGQ